MEYNKLNIGKLLKKFRNDKGLTHKQVAEYLGYKYPSGYSSIETGRINLSLENAIKLSKLFSVKVESLIFFEH